MQREPVKEIFREIDRKPEGERKKKKERDTGKHTEIRKRNKYRWGDKDKPIEKEIMKQRARERQIKKGKYK